MGLGWDCYHDFYKSGRAKERKLKSSVKKSWSCGWFFLEWKVWSLKLDLQKVSELSKFRINFEVRFYFLAEIEEKIKIFRLSVFTFHGGYFLFHFFSINKRPLKIVILKSFWWSRKRLPTSWKNQRVRSIKSVIKKASDHKSPNPSFQPHNLLIYAKDSRFDLFI